MQVVRPSRPAPRDTPRASARPGPVEWAGLAVGLGFGASLALPVADLGPGALAARGAWATLAGNVTAMGATYLLLVMVVLAGRLPVVERAVGADRLLGWHRRLAKWPMILLSLHVLATTLGFAEAARSGVAAQIGSFIRTFPDLLAAVVAYGLLVAVVVVSIRSARNRMSYETWWAIHLYTYLALGLSLAHQIVTGTDLVGHPLARAAWIVLWGATVGVVAAYRIGLPLWRNAATRLRVERVVDEGHGVVSVICAGRGLARLRAHGGQFFWWRFATRDLWWQAHPFSLSAAVHGDRMRITVRLSGDATRALAGIRPGTRVFVEGPYGAFTAGHRHADRVLLVGAGVGLTPLRALLEDLPADVDVTLIARAARREEILFAGELARLLAARDGRFVEALGPRRKVRMTASALLRTVPDVAGRDVYVCGPDGFAEEVEDAALACGVPRHAVHREQFAL